MKKAEANYAKRKKAVTSSDTTRYKFYRTWRRWILGQDEKLFPGTRAALERYSRGSGKRLSVLGREYAEVMGRVVKQRNNIARVRQRSAQLSKESDARGADLDQAQTQMANLRREAGARVELPDATTSVQDLTSAARNTVASVRREDAVRAVNLTHVKATARAEMNRMVKDNPEQAGKIRKEFDNEMKDLDIVLDRLQNKNLLAGKDPAHWSLSAIRTVKALNYMRAMGGVTISSLPDLATQTLVNGLRNPLLTLRAILSGGRSVYKAARKNEMARQAYAVEMVTGARAKAFGDIDVMTASSRWDAGLEKAREKFSFMALINWWNGTMKAVAALGAQARIVDDLAKLSDGTLSTAARKNLAAGGINKEMGERIHQQFKKYGDMEEGQALPNIGQWDDVEAAATLHAAVFKDVNRTIVTPSAGDLPRFMSTPLGTLMLQFRSFSLSQTQKVLASGLQRRDAAVVTGMIQMVAMGAIVEMLRDFSKDKDPFEKTEEEWVINAIDRSGALASIMDLSNGLDTFGMGLASIAGVNPTSRTTARSRTEHFLGPTLGTVTDLLTGIGSEFNEADIKRIRRLMPANNIFYLHRLFNKLEGTAADALIGVN